MKHLFLLLILLSLALQSCNDDFFLNGDDQDQSLGIYTLNPSSFDAIPYQGIGYVVFTDSLGDELKFGIPTIYNAHSDEQYYKNEGGKLICTLSHFTTEYIIYRLESNASSTVLYLKLFASPYKPDVDPALVADKINVWAMYPLTSCISTPLVFTKIIDQRTSPEALPAPNFIPDYSCFGNTILNVEYFQEDNNESVYYNSILGIVSFRDDKGKKWCFDRFE